MGQRNSSGNTPMVLDQVVRTVQLVWRLLVDSRVPLVAKLIIPAIVVYLVWPLDLIPDVLPVLGQIDDVGVIFLGIRLFIQLCPAEVVMEHRRAIAGETTHGRGEYVDATYRVVSDDDRKS